MISHIASLLLALISTQLTFATPLELTGGDKQFSLASLEYSPGFFPPSIEENLEDLAGKSFDTNTGAKRIFYGLDPDFKQHDRYWLATEVNNKTQNRDWVLHVSNFGFNNPKVLAIQADNLRLSATPHVKVMDTEINTIGRATTLELEPGQSYYLIVELKAKNLAWHPYVALMSNEYYQQWKTQMDFAYKLAIGIILGLILVGFICWLLMSEKVFFWGALSSLLMLIYYLEHSSLPAIFWQSTYEKTFLFWLLVSATLIAQTLFAATFLQLNKQDKVWYRAYIAILITTLSVLFVSAFLPFKIVSLLFALNYILFWAFVLGSGIAKVRFHGTFYVLYILGWLPMALSIIHVIFVLLFPQKTNHVDVSYKLIHVLYIQILHMLIHATALISRIKTLREDKVQAELLSQAKSRFIAQSSHDLRQPLNSMNLFLEYLYPHIQGEQGRSIYERLKKTQQHMQDSFNTILDLSRLEAGAMPVNIRPVLIEQLFAKLQREFQILAQAKHIELHTHSSSLNVLSDPALLERILRNLLANAIQYTQNGKVVLGCRRKRGQLVIQVLDTGCGIDAESQSKVFDIYRRSTDQENHSNGIGIGLSIVKQMCELLNHPLSLASTVGQGSQFSITLPLARETFSDFYSDDIKAQVKAPLVVLVFENQENKNKIADYFSKWGCSIKTAESIDIAYKLVESTRDEDINILLCDYPGISHNLVSSNCFQEIPRYYVAACILEGDKPLPERWIGLSETLPPAQLRALLNLAYRRRNHLLA